MIWWLLCFMFCMFGHAAPTWMHDQIAEDLAPFRSNHWKKINFDTYLKEHGKKDWLVRVQIDGKDVRVDTSEIEGNLGAFNRLNPILASLNYLAKTVNLPRVDFLITLHDSVMKSPLPLFTFAKTRGELGILFPDFEALSEGASLLRRQVYIANQKYPWHMKKNQAVWRGATTGGDVNLTTFMDLPRTKSVEVSLMFPEKVDARFNALVQTEQYSEVRSHYDHYFSSSLSIEDQIKYKYQLLIDGNSCAYSRAYWQLFSNCVILKQDSEEIQWFYRGIRPYEHYIPVQSDFSDLPQMIDWIKDHDHLAGEISTRARDFAHANLMHHHVLQYLYLVLLEYGSL